VYARVSYMSSSKKYQFDQRAVNSGVKGLDGIVLTIMVYRKYRIRFMWENQTIMIYRVV
jgi:hypothetical protein